MARIPTYTIDTVFNDNDLLLGTDGSTTALETKNFEIGGLKDYIIDQFVDPNATDFHIPVFHNSGTKITDSIISQNTYPNGTSIFIGGGLSVGGDISGTNISGTGVLTIDGEGTVTKKLHVKGKDGFSGILKLNCENNSHGVQIQGPPHSAGANYTLVLPNDTGSAGQQLTTDGTGVLSWSAGSAVTSIVAGTNVTISPTNGLGDVTVNATNQIPTNNVTGSGVTNTLTLWSDGPNNEIGDSAILQTAGGNIQIGQGHTTSGDSNLTSGKDNSLSGNYSVAFGFNNNITGNRAGGLGANNVVAGGQVWATGDGNNVGINLLDVGGNIVTSGFNNTVKSGNSCVIGSSNKLTNTQELQTVNTNFALGFGNDINDVADGIALGFNNTINNTESCVLGKNNTTNASSTYVIGKQNTVSSDADYAFGFNNTIGNSASTGMTLGHANSIDGPNSYAIGESNSLNSQKDYAFGFNNSIAGSANLAMTIGQNNSLTGSQSYAFGRNLNDGGEDNTVIIGRFNVTPTATGRIVFGTGFSETGRKNSIEIQASTNAQSGLLFKALQTSNSYADDPAAAAGGVELGELYRNGNIVQIRMQ